MELAAVARKFGITEVNGCEQFGNGHINKTYLLTTPAAKFTLQEINGGVFGNIPAMMDNIVRVTQHIEKKRATVTPLRCDDGKYYYFDGKKYFRVMTYMDGEVVERARNRNDMYVAGVGFGQFVADLSDFKEELYETIPHFHDTTVRYENFLRARAAATHLDAELAEKFASRKALCPLITDPLSKGKIPLRVTHNDTKINNVVIDGAASLPLCVIDLDTVMDGSVCYDFGDAIRAGCATAPEDERDLTNVSFRADYYEAFLEGFGGKLRPFITEREAELLPVSALVMTYECGLRFLTDHLSGNVYFKTDYPEHNFVRAASQMSLLEDMERNFTAISDLTKKFFARCV